MKSFAKLFLLLSTCAAAYALFFFDPSIDTGAGRVNNIGLLAARQNILIAACAAAVVSVLVLLFAKDAGPERDFMVAIQNSDLSAISSMLESKIVDPNGRLPSGRGWLQYAVVLKNAPAVELLLRSGANPTIADGLKRTALQEAESAASTTLHALLLNWKPAEPDVQTPKPESGGSGPHADDIVSRLDTLAKLRSSGALSEDEFQSAKSRVLTDRNHPVSGA